jgi:hypothetical protein
MASGVSVCAAAMHGPQSASTKIVQIRLEPTQPGASLPMLLLHNGLFSKVAEYA